MRCTPFDQLRSALTAPGSGQRFRSEHLTPAPLLPGEGFRSRFPKPPGSEAQPSPAGAAPTPPNDKPPVDRLSGMGCGGIIREVRRAGINLQSTASEHRNRDPNFLSDWMTLNSR